MVSDYNNIHSRLYNSQALLEGTNLMLYSINEAVLVNFTYKIFAFMHTVLIYICVCVCVCVCVCMCVCIFSSDTVVQECF